MEFWGLMAGTAANVLSNIFINMITIERHGMEIHKCPRRSTQKA